jgi:diguanylate cyclase (GGDEF)-like protein
MSQAVTGEQPRILVVDDSAPVRSTLRGILERPPLGAHVVEATDGTTALRLVVADRFDCVLCDIHMPGMDGFTLLRAVRSRMDRATLPVLVLTAMDATQDKLEGFRCGASDYITKPFSTEELLARVETAVDLARMQRQVRDRVCVDELTGLANTRAFMAALTAEVARAQDERKPFSVAILALERVPSLLEWYGEGVVNRLLVHLAELLQDGLRPYQVLARTEAHRFALLCPGMTAEQAGVLARGRQDRVAATPLANQPAGDVTVSVGVAEAALDPAEDPEALVSRATALLTPALAPKVDASP